MTQICPCTLYAMVVLSGFIVYVVAIVAVYRKNRKASKPTDAIEAYEPDTPKSSRPHKKATASSEDPNSVILKEINEKLSNIDAIAKFTRARSIADKLVESQEKTKTTDPVRAKITKTVKTLSSDGSKSSEEPETETIAERTEELA
jgi:hypothetical protein